MPASGQLQPQTGLRGDYGALALLLLLYTLQGIPMGLSASLPLILVEKGATTVQRAAFSTVALPFALKLFWAPIVDAVYFKRFGRRKTWIVPVQAALGPAFAVPRALESAGIALSDVGLIEMHEAFAGQVLCNLAAWERGWKERAIGQVTVQQLNPLGSSIAVGHPFAATGLRIVTTLANELKRRSGRYGLVSICGAGATAVAMIIERP